MYIITKFKALIFRNRSVSGAMSLWTMALGIAVVFSALCLIDSGKQDVVNIYGDHGLKLYNVSSNIGFFEEDGLWIKDNIQETKAVTMISSMEGFVRNNAKMRDTSLLMIDPAYQKIKGLKLMQGRFLTKVDTDTARHVAVIDDHSALKLYGTRDVLGKTLEVHAGDQVFDAAIVGVFRNIETGRLEGMFKEDISGTVYLPGSLTKDLSLPAATAQIIVAVSGAMEPDDAKNGIAYVLSRKYGNSMNVSIESYSQMETVNNLFEENWLIVILFSALSIITGMIGIGYHVTTLAENRKKEISYALLTGTNRYDVTFDLLYGSVVTALAYTAAGIVLGQILSLVAGIWLNIGIHFSYKALGISLFSGMSAGLLAGLNPAWKAGKTEYAEVFWECE